MIHQGCSFQCLAFPLLSFLFVSNNLNRGATAKRTYLSTGGARTISSTPSGSTGNTAASPARTDGGVNVETDKLVAGELQDGTVTVFMAIVSFVRVDFCIASCARLTCICFAALMESTSVKPATRIACGIFRKETPSWMFAACSTFLLKSLSYVDMLRIDYLGGASITVERGGKF